MGEENATMLMSPKFLCNTVTIHFENGFCYWNLHTLSGCFFPICTINVSSLVFPPLSSINDVSPVALTILRPLISIILESMMSLSPGAPDQTQKTRQAQPKNCKRRLEWRYIRNTKGISRTGYPINRRLKGLSTQINK